MILTHPHKACLIEYIVCKNKDCVLSFHVFKHFLVFYAVLIHKNTILKITMAFLALAISIYSSYLLWNFFILPCFQTSFSFCLSLWHINLYQQLQAIYILF